VLASCVQAGLDAVRFASLCMQAYQRATLLVAASGAALGQMLRWLRHQPAPPGEAPAGLQPERFPPVDGATSEDHPTIAADAHKGSVEAGPEHAVHDPRAVHYAHLAVCHQLAPQLQAVAAALRACCDALADVALGKGQLAHAVVLLQALEGRWESKVYLPSIGVLLCCSKPPAAGRCAVIYPRRLNDFQLYTWMGAFGACTAAQLLDQSTGLRLCCLISFSSGLVCDVVGTTIWVMQLPAYKPTSRGQPLSHHHAWTAVYSRVRNPLGLCRAGSSSRVVPARSDSGS
jgi:hypothetical protein